MRTRISLRTFELPRTIWLLGITSFLNDFSSEMVFSILPAFFISVLRSGAESLGLVEGIAEGASNLIKILSGRWSDRVQRRKAFAVAGYAVSVLSRPLYVLASSVGFVIGLRLIDRVGKGLRDSPRDALISLSAPAGKSGLAFGYHRAMDTLGAVAGPLVAFAILSIWPNAFNAVFITAFVIGLAAVASVALVTDVARKIGSNRQGSTRMLPRPAVVYIASVFALSVGSLPLGVLLFKTQDLGLSTASIPLFYAIYNVTYAAFSWPAGRIADRAGAQLVIALGYCFLVAAYIVLSLSSAVWILVAGFLVLGVFSALTDGVQRSYLSSLIGEDQKGTAYGYLNGVAGLGALCAGIGGGYLWQQVGDTYTLLIAALVVVAGLASLLIGQRLVRTGSG